MAYSNHKKATLFKWTVNESTRRQNYNNDQQYSPYAEFML